MMIENLYIYTFIAKNLMIYIYLNYEGWIQYLTYFMWV